MSSPPMERPPTMTTERDHPSPSDQPPAPALERPSARVPGLRTAVVVTVVLACLVAGVASVVAGRPQAVGALLGAALVGGFFLFGTLATSVAAAYAPGLSLLVALTTYVLQVVVLGLLLAGLDRSDPAPASPDLGWLAGTVIAGTLVWSLVLVVTALRTPVAPWTPRSASEVR